MVGVIEFEWLEEYTLHIFVAPHLDFKKPQNRMDLQMKIVVDTTTAEEKPREHNGEQNLLSNIYIIL